MGERELKIFLPRLITGSLFAALLGGAWDVWWHGAIGRDSFWEPPHLLLYSGVMLAIVLGLYGWFRLREKIWKWVAIVLILIPLTAPFDELWHRIFGVEDLRSVLVVWSPPHIMLALALAAGFIILLPLIKKDPDKNARQLLTALALTGVLDLWLFLASPVQPTGPWDLLGFLGAGVIAFILILMLLIANRLASGLTGATLVAVLLIMLSAFSFGEERAPGVEVLPHDHPPNFLVIFSLLVPAVFIDISRKLSPILSGVVAGVIWAGILYGFSSQFFEQIFKYNSFDAATAVFASLIGGLVAGIIVQKFFDRAK